MTRRLSLLARPWPARRLLAGGVAAAVVASLLVVTPSMAAAEPDFDWPVGASREAPKQRAGSAKGRSSPVSAATTSTPGDVPTGDPSPPPGVEAVGDERSFPPPTRTEPTPETVAGPVAQAERQSSGVVPGRSVELTDKRDGRSTTFENPDGTKTRRVYSGRVFVNREGL